MEIHRQDGEVEQRPKSIGGQIFDWMTYAGFAGVGTFFITIPLANLFNKGGKLHHIDRGIVDLSRKAGASEQLAENIASTTKFMHGGNLMLIPVMLMEHFRTHIVNGLNRLFNDPTDPESVKDAPPQTIGSIFQGRVLAWLAVFAGFSTAGKIFPETFRTFQQEFGERWCKLFRRPVKLPNGEFTKTFEFGKSASLDVFATTTAATLLYVGSHFFANRADRKKHERLERQPLAKDMKHAETIEEASLAKVSAGPETTVSNVERAENRVVTPTADLSVAQ